MKKIFRLSICAILLLFIQVAAVASNPAPLQMLKTTSQRMLDALDSNQQAIQSNPKVVDRLVRRIILPHVNLEVVSRSVIGREHWMKASSSQREAFKQQFVRSVIKTYASAFSAYSGEKIEFLPFRGSVAGKSRVVIQSRVIPPKGEAISVNYRVFKKGNTWKIYDISVDGISMVRSYHAQFAETLDNVGLTGLTKRLGRQGT